MAKRKTTKKRKVTKKKTTKKKTAQRKTTRKTARKPARKATKKKKKVTKKKKTTKKRKVNAAFMKPLQPSADFSKIVGSKPLPRTMAVKKLWAYIKKKKLQDKKNKRTIIVDAHLKPIFKKSKVDMFEMMKHLKRHLK